MRVKVRVLASDNARVRCWVLREWGWLGLGVGFFFEAQYRGRILFKVWASIRVRIIIGLFGVGLGLGLVLWVTCLAKSLLSFSMELRAAAKAARVC